MVWRRSHARVEGKRQPLTWLSRSRAQADSAVRWKVRRIAKASPFHEREGEPILALLGVGALAIVLGHSPKRARQAYQRFDAHTDRGRLSTRGRQRPPRSCHPPKRFWPRETPDPSLLARTPKAFAWDQKARTHEARVPAVNGDGKQWSKDRTLVTRDYAGASRCTPRVT